MREHSGSGWLGGPIRAFLQLRRWNSANEKLDITGHNNNKATRKAFSGDVMSLVGQQWIKKSNLTISRERFVGDATNATRNQSLDGRL